MTQNKHNWKLLVLALQVFACSGMLLAQEPQTPEQPKPAGRGIPAITDPSIIQNEPSDQDTSTPWSADTAPLTGLQTTSLGRPDLRHNYWVPGLQFSSTIQNQPNGTAGPGTSGGWYSTNFFGASLSLLESSSHTQLDVNYTGGGFVTTQSGQNNGWYQQSALGETLKWKRWQMQILDQFSYLPESQFGFGGGTPLSTPGIGGSLGPTVPGIGTSVVPNQSIYAATGPRYSNTIIDQITYMTSPRGSFTAGGSYGLLRFSQAGNVSTDDYIGNIGYNYALTKEDSIGVVYRFTAFHYQGDPQSVGDHTVSVAYGRQITRRLALQIFGGPEITTYRIPVGNKKKTLGGNGSASIKYAFREGNQVSATYFHGVSGGSGVLIGSNTDQITLSGNARLTRVWSVHGNFGFSSDRALSSQTGIQGSNYNSLFITGGLDRPIGRNLGISLAYTAQIQYVNPTVCAGAGCNTSFTQNVVTISIQWHANPFVL